MVSNLDDHGDALRGWLAMVRAGCNPADLRRAVAIRCGGSRVAGRRNRDLHFQDFEERESPAAAMPARAALLVSNFAARSILISVRAFDHGVRDRDLPRDVLPAALRHTHVRRRVHCGVADYFGDAFLERRDRGIGNRSVARLWVLQAVRLIPAGYVAGRHAVLLEILLMIVLRGPELRRGLDLCDDRALEFS